MTPAVCNDSELVAQSLAGSREAFSQIVGRYQSLVCSLAYSATGDLGRSEDLAQETFLTAWKQLGGLSEPGKLRAWLCGIARNLTNNALRRQGREPTHEAETLDVAGESPALEPLPSDQAVSREEAAILWRSLERIPETYREPLILFYREHQSIENVAIALDLTEDAVRQRLSRGRKLLEDHLAILVEGTLARSSPGTAFTLQVMSALPVLATSAGISAASSLSKGGVAVKAGWLALFGVAFGPVAGVLSGYLGYKIAMDSARSEKERTFIKAYSIRVWICIALGLALPIAIAYWGPPLLVCRPRLLAWTIVGAAACFLLGFVLVSSWLKRQRERAVIDARGTGSVANAAANEPTFEYRSPWTLLGLPLVHARFSRTTAAAGRPVCAWIAFGERAYGLIFAFGFFSVAPLSFGTLSFGIISMGACATGIISMAGLAIGYRAVGGIAIGWHASGSLALGWRAALGVLAVAHDFADGQMGAYAAHVGDHAARNYMRADFAFLNTQLRCMELFFAVWIVLGAIFWRRIVRVRQKKAAAAAVVR